MAAAVSRLPTRLPMLSRNWWKPAVAAEIPLLCSIEGSQVISVKKTIDCTPMKIVTCQPSAEVQGER